MRVRFALRGTKKKTRTAIYASISYSGRRVIVFPHESIETTKWSSKNGMPKSSPDNAALHSRLLKAEAIFRETYDQLLATENRAIPNPDTFKQEIYKRLNPIDNAKERESQVSNILIVDCLQRMIDDSLSGKRLSAKKSTISKDSIKPYTSTKNHFEEFQRTKGKQYYVTDLGRKLIDDFDNYLCIDLKLSENSAGKYMKTLKACIRYMMELRLVPSNILIENKIHVRRERSDNIYLNEKEIEGLLNLKNLGKADEKVRDLFVVGCYTGLRFSDYSKISQSQISESYISLHQKKTGERVTIPIHPIVKQILAKYPTGLSARSMQTFNSDLKKIAEKVPELNKVFEKKITKGRKTIIEQKKKWEMLSSHTARRSFATNEYLNNTPVLTIMAITGHRTQAAFMAYIKATGEEHANLLQKEWDKRNNADERKNISG